MRALLFYIAGFNFIFDFINRMTSKLTQKDRKFTLVKFIPEDGQEEKVEIEIVPTFWVDYDLERRMFFTKFIPPPYSAKKLRVLQEIVKTCKKPMNDWPLYDVDVRGYGSKFIFGFI